MHKDILGQEIKEGDYVAATLSEQRTPDIYKVVGFTPKMVRCQLSGDEPTLKKPMQILVVDAAKYFEQDITDLLGEKLEVGDYVFSSDGEYIDPIIFEVVGFSKDKVQVKSKVGSSYRKGGLRYGHDFIKVDPRAVTMQLLKEGELHG